MKKYGNEARTVVVRAAGILALVQIVLGSAWTVMNLGGFQEFRETEEILEIAKTLVTDEYVGILYPVLVRFALALARLLPLPYYGSLSVFQLAVCFCALYVALKGVPYRPLAALFILSFPIVNQLCLAVLPQSLAASFLLLGLAGASRRHFLAGGVCWLLAGLFLPEYFVLGAVLYVGCLLSVLWKEKKAFRKLFCRGVLAILMVCLAWGGVKAAATREYSRGRMARTPAAMALHRMVWPNFSNTQYFWPKEVLDVFGEEDLVRVSRDPEKVLTEFGIRLEEAYGKEAAQSLYWDMAGTALQVRTREIAADIAGDFLSYCFPPVSLGLALRGESVSLNGWNYGEMAQRTPVLARYYVSYSCRAFPVLVVLLTVGWALDLKRCGKCGKGEEGFGAIAAWSAAGAFLAAAWYTLSRAGMQDCRNAAWIQMAWGLGLAFLFSRLARRSRERADVAVREAGAEASVESAAGISRERAEVAVGQENLNGK